MATETPVPENETTETTPKVPFLSDKLYERLKWLTLIALPAFGALYFSLSQIWGWPKAEEVVGSVTVICTFLGVILGLATKSYNNSDASNNVGKILVKDTEDGVGYTLDIGETSPDVINRSKQVVFEVEHVQ